MPDTDLLEAELRAVREELARRDLQRHPDDAMAMVAPRDDRFLRLKTLDVERLEAHEAALERDLADLEAGIAPDDTVARAPDGEEPSDD